MSGVKGGEERTTAVGLARYARDYYDAAVAADNVLGERKGYEFCAPAPVMFLVAHAVELGLKAFLRWRGLGLEELKKLGHNLDVCWSVASDHGITDYVDLTTQDLGVMRILSALHSSTELRYIQTGSKTLPIFGALEEMACKILDEVCPLVGYR